MPRANVLRDVHRAMGIHVLQTQVPAWLVGAYRDRSQVKGAIHPPNGLVQRRTVPGVSTEKECTGEVVAVVEPHHVRVPQTRIGIQQGPCAPVARRHRGDIHRSRNARRLVGRGHTDFARVGAIVPPAQRMNVVGIHAALYQQRSDAGRNNPLRFRRNLGDDSQVEVVKVAGSVGQHTCGRAG